jgi:hypothetical protein
MVKKKLKNKNKGGRSPSKKSKDSKIKKLIKIAKQKRIPKSKIKKNYSKKAKKN